MVANMNLHDMTDVCTPFLDLELAVDALALASAGCAGRRRQRRCVSVMYRGVSPPARWLRLSAALQSQVLTTT